jgi:WD40 repeat protein
MDSAAPSGSTPPTNPSAADGLVFPTIPDHDLLGCIGRGSYGEIWLGRNKLGTLRAIKIVRRAVFDNARPFEREFKGIQKFEPISRSHEGLVDILQIGGTEEYFYYVMELADASEAVISRSVIGKPVDPASPVVTGSLNTDSLITDYSPRTLRSDLKRHGRLPVSRCVEISLALAEALGHLHQHGLVHRDIKPSNIIFVKGTPRLADIGLVAEVGEARSFVGTQGFIPPEGPGTPQADLYSLGKALYEMTTGLDRQEFPKLPPQLRELPDAEALVEINEIVLKACDDDPRRRYATAQAMRDDLALLQAGKSIQRLRLVERRLTFLSRVGLVGAALMIVAGGLYWGARTQAKATARQLYVAEMNLAFQAWDGGSVSRARALLAKHREAEPGLRGFEWRLLEQLCGEGDARFTLGGHTGIVWSVAISPDKSRLVSAGADGLLKVWDTTSGRLLTNLIGTDRVVHAVAFSPDGRTLASGGRDYTVILRDASSFEVRHRMRRHKDAIRSIAFSPDGRRMASGAEDRQILLWDVLDGRLLDRFPESMSVESLAFAPDSSLLAAAGTDTSVHLWNLATREMRLVAPQRALLKEVAFSPDGKILATAGYDGITELWDVTRDESLGIISGVAPVDALAFSPDGQWLAIGRTDASVHLWNARSRRWTRQLRGHTAGVRLLEFSRDGAWLASASDDSTARVWEVHSRAEQRHVLAHAGLVNAVAFAPNAPRLVTTGGRANELHVWDSGTGEELAVMRAETNAIWSLATSADGAVLFTGGVDGSLRRWEVATRQATHTRKVHTHGIDAVALSPDGRTIATACRGAPVKLWDASTFEAIATLPGDALVFRSVAFSPDGKWLAAGGRTNEVCIWNVTTRTLLARLTGHASEVRSVVFSSDSATLASADDDRTIRLWDVNTRRLLTRLEGHDAPIKSLAFSPDDRTLASGSEDSTVKLWNLRLRQEVATLRGHASQVTRVAFSPDGTMLASAGGDGVVRLWRADHSDLRSR